MTSKKKSYRILLLAESANPEWVSVPLAGWSNAKAISEINDVHIVTQIRNRDAFVRAGLKEGQDFSAIDSELVAKKVHSFSKKIRGGANRGWTTVMALSSISYYYFEHLIWKEFETRLRNSDFDLVHRLTPVSPTVPSLMAQKCHRLMIPFVIGPINGGLPWPAGFEKERVKEREWLSYARSAYKLLPYHNATRRFAKAIVVGSRATYSQIAKKYHEKCVYIPENAILKERFTRRVENLDRRPIKVAFVGRLVPYKGADMLLEAAAQLAKEKKLEMDIIGDGPEMGNLKDLVRKLDIASQVKLDGWIDHTELQDRLVKSSVLGFPSIREFGGGVVLEAMALGLVPIIVDYGGPGELATQDAGFSVPIGTRDQIIEGFRKVLVELVNDPSVIFCKSEMARRRVFNLFTWQAKAQQVTEVYRWVLGETNEKPDFGMPLCENKLALSSYKQS